jgi:hypothetical protein
MFKRSGLTPDDLPLMSALIDVVVNGKPVDLPFDKFFGEV